MTTSDTREGRVMDKELQGHAVELCTLEDGELLWAKPYIFSRLHRVGDEFIVDGVEYRVVKNGFTKGAHGGYLVEHVVRRAGDKT